MLASYNRTNGAIRLLSDEFKIIAKERYHEINRKHVVDLFMAGYLRRFMGDWDMFLTGPDFIKPLLLAFFIKN